MLKKFLYILITMCQLLFFAGTYVLRYYVKKKLGMNRWLVYNNMQWEKVIPTSALKISVTILIAIITSIIIYKIIAKKKNLSINQYVLVVGLVIITIFTIIYLMNFSTLTDKTYYLNTVLLILVYILQLLKLKIFVK